MLASLRSATPLPRTVRRGARRRWLLLALAALVLAVLRAGAGDVVNADGWPNFARFWRSIVSPETSGEFLRLTARATATTLAYAVVGTALSLVIGVLAAPLLSERMWDGDQRGGWRGRLRAAGCNAARVIAAVPRSVHEILWALLLIQVYGPAPIVAIIAIGVPFGAVTAAVFAETLDEADPAAFRLLRAAGASRPTALVYGILPGARSDLTSYGFYRFECAIRAAAILGIIGAGGLGFQLTVSFQTLRYGEMWTLIFALMALGLLAEGWSAAVRRSPRAGRSLWVVLIAVPVAWWWLEADLSLLWDEQRLEGLSRLIDRMFPPHLGPRGWSGLAEAMVDTLAMSVLAIVLSVLLGLGAAIWMARPPTVSPAGGLGGRLGETLIGSVLRFIALGLRAVPPPVWAFLFTLILFPGIWPGAVALGVYNAGIMSRLFAETIEDQPPGNAEALIAEGSRRSVVAAYAWIPAAASRFVALSVYRWEVIVRETLVVGVVGAAGLGRLIQEDLVARDFAAVLSSTMALMALTAVAALVGARARRAFR